jgi:hypothetical protein
VLKVTGISQAERSDAHVMKSISDVTRIDANTRKQRLDKFIQDLRVNPDASAFLEKWGFQIGDSHKLTGVQIPPPKLVMCRGCSSTPTEFPLPSDLSFQRNLRDYALFQVPAFKVSYMIVALLEHRELVERGLIPTMNQVSSRLNVMLPTADKVYVEGRHPNDFCRAMAEAMDRDGIPSFIVIVLPTRDKQRYDGIKTFLTTQIGVPSQCVRTDVVDKGLSVITNVVVQIVSKTGGVPYRVSSTNLVVGRTMVVGLAIETSRGSAPVAAGVASRDAGLTQFFSDSASALGTDTIITDQFIRDFMARALEVFHSNNKTYPTRVIVYRDGVSYGQMPKLKQFEVPPLVETLNSICGGEVSLVFMVAQKHGSIRVLRTQGSGVANAQPGTVVTDGIGAKGVAEFYLISHFANQGSASPTRYTVIHHSPVSWTDDQLIKTTHYQTLQYPNWPGGIRIPACLMLAVRLADFSKQHLGSERAVAHLGNYLHYL